MKPKKPNRLDNALTDVLLPRDSRSALRHHLDDLLTTIHDCHGNHARYSEERAALGKLAALSDMLYGDPNRMPAALFSTLRKADKAIARDIERAIKRAMLVRELDSLYREERLLLTLLDQERENSSDA